MSSSSVPPIQFTPSGIVVPQESAVLAGAQADINAAFGGGVNPGLSTPQGQLASSESAIIAEKNSEIAYITNQVDPQYASGRFQDAIGRIYLMSRQPATATQVVANLTGLVGTVIPAGALAQDTSGNTYTLMAQVTIGPTGTTQGVFQNIATGPIPCPDGTLTQVYQAVAGWDALSNPTLAGSIPSATLGSNVETTAEFEYRRQNSVAANGHGTPQAIYGAVFGVPGVTDCYVVDNPTGATVNMGATNYPVAPNSVYAAAIGGTPAAIAQAIWSKKDVGCNYNGNTSVTVTDPSGYSYPQPSYTVNFNIPTPTPIYFAVQVVNNAALPSNIVSLIQNAIIAQFTGAGGSIPARIGSMILAPNFYGAVIGAAPNVQIISIAVGTTSTPTALQVQMGIDQGPTITAANIAVTLVTL